MTPIYGLTTTALGPIRGDPGRGGRGCGRRNGPARQPDAPRLGGGFGGRRQVISAVGDTDVDRGVVYGLAPQGLGEPGLQSSATSGVIQRDGREDDGADNGAGREANVSE